MPGRARPVGLVVVIVIASCVLLALLLRRWRNDAPLRYATRVTSLPLLDAEVIEVADDGEMSTQMYLLLPPESVSMVRARGLVPTPPPARWPDDTFSSTEQFAAWPPPSSSVLLGIEGCTGGNAWFGYLDESSGELWLEILYPDWGGDPPGCRTPPWGG